jgi:Domain of unknown function (DUF397)
MLATDRLPNAAWRKSSYSGGNEGGSNCVEVAGTGALIAVRDSKNPSRGSLAFSPAQWRAFVTTVRAG